MFSFLFFVMTTIAVNYNLMYRFDNTIISFIQQFENPTVTTVFIIFTNIGSFIGTMVVLFFFIYLFYTYNSHREALILTTVTLATPLFNIILKQLIQRPRPKFHQLIEIAGYSFPSGHAMYATSLYLITCILFWKKLARTWQRCLLMTGTCLIIVIIGVSRIYLGVHYPSDIIGGFFASMFMISLTLYINLVIKQYSSKEN